MTVLFNRVHGTTLVATNDHQNMLTEKVKQTIDRVLLKRTYWESNVLDRASDDDYDTTDARQFMQCAFVCAKRDEYQEALWWYRRAHILFCGDTDAVIYDDGIQLTSSNAEKWDIAVESTIVTDYGNVRGFQDVAYVHENSMSVNESIEREQNLRWGTDGWFELIDKERKHRKEQQAIADEFAKRLQQ